jgi:hypothetical protein
VRSRGTEAGNEGARGARVMEVVSSPDSFFFTGFRRFQGIPCMLVAATCQKMRTMFIFIIF